MPSHRPPAPRQVICVVCGEAFSARKPSAKYCSVRCAADANKLKMDGTQRPAKLPPATVGALNELLASAHLMNHGYHVFRAISPSAPFDLYVFKDGESLRAEVTTGYIYHRGTKPGKGTVFPTKKVRQLLKGEFDILLIVFKDRVVEIRTEQDVKAILAGWP